MEDIKRISNVEIEVDGDRYLKEIKPASEVKRTMPKTKMELRWLLYEFSPETERELVDKFLNNYES